MSATMGVNVCDSGGNVRNSGGISATVGEMSATVGKLYNYGLGNIRVQIVIHNWLRGKA